MIEVRNISKRFGSQTVLRDVSLTFGEGTTVAVVGPSGVGKSVLLKVILGILTPERGEVLIDGRSITAASSELERNEIRSSIGALFQSAALFDSLTVYENVTFPLLHRLQLSASEAHERAIRLMRSLGLERYTNKLPGEISLGIRKRVGLARALATEPKVVLFDEPNTGLDPLVGQEVYDLINETRRTWGYTGIVVSHELPEVFQVSDRVVMLLGGRVIADGSPEEMARTTDPAVQQFMQGRVDGPIRIQ